MSKLIGATALSLALIAGVAAYAPPADADLHFGLKSSTPAAEATVESPSQIRLWFTQAPQDGTTSIRLVEADAAGVHVTEVMADAEDPASFYVDIHGAMPNGTYTVSWRGMGADGHVVRDTFEFTVAAN